MKNKKLTNLAFVAACYISTAIAGPEWTHQEQATWGAIQDPSQTVVPLNYPYAECSIGGHQSPIDFADATINTTRNLNHLEIWYDVDQPVFFNSGHAIQANTSSSYKGELKIGEESFPLIQFHFHSPSEHAVAGNKFPAEAHFVHVAEDGRLVVLGIVVMIGVENATFQTMLDNMPTTSGDKNLNTGGIQINPAELLPAINHQSFDYFSLAGSLTTPPCSEGVQWYLMLNPITISQAQLDKLQTFYNNNNREPQPLNGRVVNGQAGSSTN